jgi:hypothetical protein
MAQDVRPEDRVSGDNRLPRKVIGLRERRQRSLVRAALDRRL